MTEQENPGSFFKENKKLAKEWIDVQAEIYKLRFLRIFWKSAGYLIWLTVFLFLLSVLLAFLGVVAGFWFSDLTGSRIIGFGLTTLIIGIFILIMFIFRNALLINPILRNLIKKAGEESGLDNKA